MTIFIPGNMYFLILFTFFTYLSNLLPVHLCNSRSPWEIDVGYKEWRTNEWTNEWVNEQMNEMMHCYWDSCCWDSWRLRGRRTWYCGSEGLPCKLRQTYWGARAHLGSCQDFWPGGVIFLFAKMKFFSITILLRKKVLKISIFLVNTYCLVEMSVPESVIRKKISGGKWRDWGILWLNFFLFAHLCSDELTWILNTFAHLFTPLLIQ